MLTMIVLAAAVYAHPEQLVETGWLAEHARDRDIRIVDMRMNGYADGHVPGAVYLSPVAIRDAKSPPTFLPAPGAFEEMMARLGISDATRVIVYDERGGMYAARLWDMMVGANGDGAAVQAANDWTGQLSGTGVGIEIVVWDWGSAGDCI